MIETETTIFMQVLFTDEYVELVARDEDIHGPVMHLVRWRGLLRLAQRFGWQAPPRVSRIYLDPEPSDTEHCLAPTLLTEADVRSLAKALAKAQASYGLDVTSTLCESTFDPEKEELEVFILSLDLGRPHDMRALRELLDYMKRGPLWVFPV